MNYQQYLKVCEQVINSKEPLPPYSDPVYLHYAKLGYSRMNRWYKTLTFSGAFLDAIMQVRTRQQWILITEPWCGDAAPVVPAVVKIAALNPFIEYDLQLRDSEPYLINAYLTNGGKSIPKIIVRDENWDDVFTWGPRPAGAQQLVEALKASGTHYETVATELQNWYNNDKGVSFQQELVGLLQQVTLTVK